MSNQSYPIVAIVGRPNVGKSTLFNRISRDAQTLIYDEPGVTRDVIGDVVSLQGKLCTLYDTGGIIMRKQQDPILEEVRQRALGMLDRAAVILFVCDGEVGPLPDDFEIAKLLHKKGVPVFTLINKTDIAESQEHIHAFERFGFPIYQISATHGRGIDAVLKEVAEQLPKTAPASDYEQARCRVAIIGKPNVGKSSLMNELVKQDRVIVADKPGTTREAVSEQVTFYQEDIKLTDTPGMRRQRGVSEPLEQLMVKSALRAIDAAHIVILVVDGASGELSDQELKLAFYVFEEKHKALIILFNKQDLVVDEQKEELGRQKDQYKYFLDKIEMLSISCKTGKNVGKVLPLINTVWQRVRQQFASDELTMTLKESLMHKPLYRREQMLTFARAQQTKHTPITIELVVGNPPAWEATQLGYIENQLRKKYDLKSAALALIPRKW
jgi:GTP-binding protein